MLRNSDGDKGRGEVPPLKIVFSVEESQERSTYKAKYTVLTQTDNEFSHSLLTKRQTILKANLWNDDLG